MAKKKNSVVSDLNDYLFAQLDAITNPDLQGEELEQELARSKAVCDIARNIIGNTSLALSACRLNAEYGREAAPEGLIEAHE